MSWKYLLVYSSDFMTYDEAKTILNFHPEIIQWLHIFENTFIIESTLMGSVLGDMFLRYARKTSETASPPGLFFITEIHKDKFGFIPRAGWDLINGKPKNVTPVSLAGDDDDGEIPF